MRAVTARESRRQNNKVFFLFFFCHRGSNYLEDGAEAAASVSASHLMSSR